MGSQQGRNLYRGQIVSRVPEDFVCVRDREVDAPSRSRSLGYTAFEERLFSRKTSTYFRNKIATLLGGIAAEEVLFGEFGSGAGGDPSADLNRATDLATMMETKWGLGKTLAVEPGDSPRELSAFRHRRKALSKSVEATLQAEFRRAKFLLEEHRDALLDLHAGLLRKGSLAAAVVRAAVERNERFVLPHKAETAGYELGQ